MVLFFTLCFVRCGFEGEPTGPSPLSVLLSLSENEVVFFRGGLEICHAADIDAAILYQLTRCVARLSSHSAAAV